MGAELFTAVIEDNVPEMMDEKWEQICKWNKGAPCLEGYDGFSSFMDSYVLEDKQIFASEQEAEEYLADHHEKWECALAVPFYINPDQKPSSEELAEEQNLIQIFQQAKVGAATAEQTNDPEKLELAKYWLQQAKKALDNRKRYVHILVGGWAAT